MSTTIPIVPISGEHTEYCIQARTEEVDWYVWRLWHAPHSGGSATIDPATIQREIERLREVDELKRLQFRFMQRTVITTEWTEP